MYTTLVPASTPAPPPLLPPTTPPNPIPLQLMSATIGKSGSTDGKLMAGTAPSVGLNPYCA